MVVGVIVLAIKKLWLTLIIFIIVSTIILFILWMVKKFCGNKTTYRERPSPIQINKSNSLSPSN